MHAEGEGIFCKYKAVKAHKLRKDKSALYLTKEPLR